MVEKENGHIRYEHDETNKMAVFETENGQTMAITQSMNMLDNMQKTFLKH